MLLKFGCVVCIQLLRDKVDSSRVAEDAQPTDNTDSLVTQEAAVPELFSGVDIADVDFQEGDCNSGKSIAKSHARVCKTSRIDDDELGFSAGLVYPVDDGPFVVRLEVFNFDS